MAIEYGLSEKGFRRKRLPEIVQGLHDRVADKLGVPIQTTPNSIFGQIHGVYGYALAELWEEMEKTYLAMYPSTAEGMSLSNAAGLAGIAQVEADQTAIIATCYGSDGASVPYGAQIASNANPSMVFFNQEVLEKISMTRLNVLHLTIPNITPGTKYTLIINGISASRVAGNSDTDMSIFANFIEAFEDIEEKTFTIKDNALIITADDPAEPFSAIVSNVTVAKMGSPFLFQSALYGAIVPAIGEVNQIITNYTGWTEVSNDFPANSGRDAETDIALRQRWSASVYGRGSAMVDSIAAAIYQECKGVTAVTVYENTSDETDGFGRPPHSVEAVVSGGLAQDIADVIMQKKAAGIDTYGNIKRISYDSQSIPHTIYFNRPEEIKIWLHIEVTTDDAEYGEAFGGLHMVKTAIMEVAKDFKVGQDVILQKFFGSVYKSVTGIGYVVITAATGDTPGAYSAQNVLVSPRQYAVFDESRIEVAAT